LCFLEYIGISEESYSRMKHIHFVIYRLKSTLYLKMKYIKPLNDVKIQRTTITFTKKYENRTVFINKMINSWIMRMFIFLIIFYIYIFYFVSQVLCICTDDRGYFSMRDIFLFYCNDFIFLLFNNLMRNRHCIWIKTRGPQRWLVRQS
jgi:uncharacterized membrane protein YdbT with pleckstrin-like domain